MIKIKKIIFLVLLSLIYIEKGSTEITDSLFMTIGNKPITKSDIVNEIKLILILNNENYSDDKRDRLHEAAVKSTIERNVKEIELERNDFFKFNEEDLEKELIRLASNIYMDLETLKNICASNEVDFAIIENQVKTELYWNSLIFELYKNRLSINLDHIEERLKLIHNKKKVEEYLISEILINNIEKDKFESEIEKLKSRIKIEGFENVAKNLSISKSGISGGDLGWISENVISGYVVTIDDMTSLILAEKHTAWSDIARKIAHEVSKIVAHQNRHAEDKDENHMEQFQVLVGSFRKVLVTPHHSH